MKRSLRMIEFVLLVSVYTPESPFFDNSTHSTQGRVLRRNCSSSPWVSDESYTSADLSRQILSGMQCLVQLWMFPVVCPANVFSIHLSFLITYYISSLMMGWIKGHFSHHFISFPLCKMLLLQGVETEDPAGEGPVEMRSLSKADQGLLW